ncbi:hypothetical protein Pelo_8537 [Pelomyxa schiedti]|nr:hypothetical protein Pelo_8537 [Pelomyxa schiedti]
MPNAKCQMPNAKCQMPNANARCTMLKSGLASTGIVIAYKKRLQDSGIVVDTSAFARLLKTATDTTPHVSNSKEINSQEADE